MKSFVRTEFRSVRRNRKEPGGLPLAFFRSAKRDAHPRLAGSVRIGSGSDFGLRNPLRFFGFRAPVAGRSPTRFGNTLGFRFFGRGAIEKRVTFLRLSGPNWSFFDRLIIGWSQVQVLLGPPLFYLPRDVLSRRSASHTLITDWRVTPRRAAICPGSSHNCCA